MTKRDYASRKMVIWPENLDSTRARRLGRKLSLGDSVKKPSVQEVYEASVELGLNPELVEASYPGNWMYSRGYVLVDKKGSKSELLRMVAGKIREKRGGH
ncbi:MAG: signal recognition particle protein Srp19 [Desulfurococcales archaeon]|nr:signal recognition particle protein Srp19 [Desulfurococcales archaeon]